MTFKKTAPPGWLLAMWKEIDDKTFGRGFDDPAIESVQPTMTRFFYMDEADPTKIGRWVGSVGPIGF